MGPVEQLRIGSARTSRSFIGLHRAGKCRNYRVGSATIVAEGGNIGGGPQKVKSNIPFSDRVGVP